jgi:parallel beta-helix repeat protein
MRARTGCLTLSLAAAIGMCQSASAASWCVNPGGTSGCFSSINAAVAAASANDSVNVFAGTYNEDVVIGKALSLTGANLQTTIIDATGLSNGIYIDGIDNAGLANVLVRGFKIQNANFEGILVGNASGVTIVGNWVIGNNKGLNVSGPSCPGIPSFETSEGDDCGEGIHLLGADHATVANNLVQINSGGILLSDDTGQAHDNLVTGNTVQNNAADCGITLASHPPASITGSSTPLGVVHNTIANNTSEHNGYNPPGSGSGVGIFSPVPAGMVTGNVILNNTITGNGLPGVAMHSHAPGQFLNDNVIAGNQIAANGADTGDAATPGTTGINVFGVSAITGTIISQNTIQQESFDIVINTPAEVNAHLNNLLGATVGVDNIGAGTGNAVANWWGCVSGPGTPQCASIGGAGILFAPWLLQSFTP